MDLKVQGKRQTKEINVCPWHRQTPTVVKIKKETSQLRHNCVGIKLLKEIWVNRKTSNELNNNEAMTEPKFFFAQKVLKIIWHHNVIFNSEYPSMTGRKWNLR